jgi:hypothetical protein
VKVAPDLGKLANALFHPAPFILDVSLLGAHTMSTRQFYLGECLRKYRQSCLLKSQELIGGSNGVPDAQSQVDHGGLA